MLKDTQTKEVIRLNFTSHTISNSVTLLDWAHEIKRNSSEGVMAKMSKGLERAYLR